MRRQTAGVFDAVLPAVARWAVAPAGTGIGDLVGVERDAVAGAAPRRVGEFAAGRVAARAALVALGEPPVAIPRAGRRPCWPPGVVGSITHCAGLAAAAVAHAADLVALGIDAEPAVPLDPAIDELVSTSTERGRLGGELAGTVVFSAKEAFYKAWSARGGGWLEFHDVDAELAVDGSFEVRLRSGPPSWAGRWAVRDGYVVTAAWAAPA